MCTVRLAATIMRLLVSTAHAGDGGGGAGIAERWDATNGIAGIWVSSYYGSQLFAPPYIAVPQGQMLASMMPSGSSFPQGRTPPVLTIINLNNL